MYVFTPKRTPRHTDDEIENKDTGASLDEFVLRFRLGVRNPRKRHDVVNDNHNKRGGANKKRKVNGRDLANPLLRNAKVQVKARDHRRRKDLEDGDDVVDGHDNGSNKVEPESEPRRVLFIDAGVGVVGKVETVGVFACDLAPLERRRHDRVDGRDEEKGVENRVGVLGTEHLADLRDHENKRDGRERPERRHTDIDADAQVREKAEKADEKRGKRKTLTSSEPVLVQFGFDFARVSRAVIIRTNGASVVGKAENVLLSHVATLLSEIVEERDDDKVKAWGLGFRLGRVRVRACACASDGPMRPVKTPSVTRRPKYDELSSSRPEPSVVA